MPLNSCRPFSQDGVSPRRSVIKRYKNKKGDLINNTSRASSKSIFSDNNKSMKFNKVKQNKSNQFINSNHLISINNLNLNTNNNYYLSTQNIHQQRMTSRDERDSRRTYK